MIETPDHHGSHQNLLWEAQDTPSHTAELDAIIVPTVRPAAYLAAAAQLAMDMKCPLITLHSGKWTSSGVALRRLRAGVDLIAIDVPETSYLRLPDLETSRLLSGTVFASRTDTSAKRNLGLMLAHMLGWSRVLFFDDDIRVSQPSSLKQAAGLLDTYHAAGLVVSHYPDHSVVCHAYRMVGGHQKPFIGGGALATETKRSNSFFPGIYNDDWFYLLDTKKGLRQVAATGTATQWPYDPFLTPRRAREEEFGDVLAEGVFWILDRGGSVSDADLSHWAQFLDRRRRFIEHVLLLVSGSDINPADRGRMMEALRAALRQLAYIKPELCRGYLEAWASDRDRWQQHLNRLPVQRSRPEALRLLARRGGPPLKWRTRNDEEPRQGSSLDVSRF